MTDEEQAAMALTEVVFLDDTPPPEHFQAWVRAQVHAEHDAEEDPC